MCSLLEIWACDSDTACQGFSLPGHSGRYRDGHKTWLGSARNGFRTSLELLRERHLSFLLDLNLGASRARTIVRHHEEPQKKASIREETAERWREIWVQMVSSESRDETVPKAS